MPTLADAPICDFCSGRPVTHELPAKDFLIADIVRSRGNWMACAICARFIIQNDWKGLGVRAINTLRTRYGRDPLQDELDSIIFVHASVKKYMTGEIRPI